MPRAPVQHTLARMGIGSRVRVEAVPAHPRLVEEPHLFDTPHGIAKGRLSVGPETAH